MENVHDMNVQDFMQRMRDKEASEKRRPDQSVYTRARKKNRKGKRKMQADSRKANR